MSKDLEIINKAPHYQNEIEVIEFIEGLGGDFSIGAGFAIGSIIKYTSRQGRKEDALQDLLKARYYIDRLIKQEAEKGVKSIDTLRKFNHREIHED